MEILVEWARTCFAVEEFKRIRERYIDKILRSDRINLTIKFKNGDTLKFVSENGLNDGRRADIASGPHAKYFTFASKVDKPIRNYDEILEYIDNMQVSTSC